MILKRIAAFGAGLFVAERLGLGREATVEHHILIPPDRGHCHVSLVQIVEGVPP